MLRGIVYSFLAISFFLFAAIIAITTGLMSEESADLTGGWLLLVALFGIGPVGFGIGYWHHRRLNPSAPQWDAETGD